MTSPNQEKSGAKVTRQKEPANVLAAASTENKTHLRNNAQALLEIMLSTLLVCYSFSKIRHKQKISSRLFYIK